MTPATGRRRLLQLFGRFRGRDKEAVFTARQLPQEGTAARPWSCLRRGRQGHEPAGRLAYDPPARGGGSALRRRSAAIPSGQPDQRQRSRGRAGNGRARQPAPPNFMTAKARLTQDEVEKIRL
jgi:hypothetical protein